MLVLGVILLIVAAVAVLAVVVRGGDPVAVDLNWFTVKTDARGAFFAGAATLLVVVLALWLIAHGTQRSRRRRKEMKVLRERAEVGDEVSRREEARRSPQAESQPRYEPGYGSRPADTRRSDDHFDSTPRDEPPPPPPR